MNSLSAQKCPHLSWREGQPSLQRLKFMENSERSQIGRLRSAEWRHAPQRAFRGQEGDMGRQKVGKGEVGECLGARGVTMQVGQATVTVTGPLEPEVPSGS